MGTGLVLRNNGGDDLRIDAGSTFAFRTGVPSGAHVQRHGSRPTDRSDAGVTIATSTGSGTVTNANVSSVQINCVTTEFSIGGTVTV